MLPPLTELSTLFPAREEDDSKLHVVTMQTTPGSSLVGEREREREEEGRRGRVQRELWNEMAF